MIQTKCLNYFSCIIRGQTHDIAILYLFLVFMFFDYIIITYNCDMSTLRKYATEHWQRVGGEVKNRHAVLRLYSSKTFSLTAVVVRRPRLMPSNILLLHKSQ